MDTTNTPADGGAQGPVPAEETTTTATPATENMPATPETTDAPAQ